MHNPDIGEIDVATMTMAALKNLAHESRDSVSSVCVAYLEDMGAGCPDTPLFQEQVRQDAAFWASCAHQAELEAYLAAILSALSESPLTHRGIKKLAALSWQRMGAEDRAAFKAWINNQETGGAQS